MNKDIVQALNVVRTALLTLERGQAGEENQVSEKQAELARLQQAIEGKKAELLTVDTEVSTLKQQSTKVLEKLDVDFKARVASLTAQFANRKQVHDTAVAELQRKFDETQRSTDIELANLGGKLDRLRAEREQLEDVVSQLRATLQSVKV